MMPQIMILDRPPENQDTVINIELQEDVIILHALEAVTIALLGGQYPVGTLTFKAGQVIMLPFGVFEEA